MKQAPPAASTGRDAFVRDKAGVVYVEFLLAFIPLLTLFLGTTQLLFVYGSKLLVQHAASNAARTAQVVLDDEPRFYGGSPRGTLTGRALTSHQLLAGYHRYALASPAAPEDLSRRATVELSALLVLVALEAEGYGRVENAVHGPSLERAAQGTRERTRVQLSVPDPDSGEFSVRVEYRAPCVVPIGRNLVCGGGEQLQIAQVSSTNHRASYPYSSER